LSFKLFKYSVNGDYTTVVKDYQGHLAPKKETIQSVCKNAGTNSFAIISKNNKAKTHLSIKTYNKLGKETAFDTNALMNAITCTYDYTDCIDRNKETKIETVNRELTCCISSDKRAKVKYVSLFSGEPILNSRFLLKNSNDQDGRDYIFEMIDKIKYVIVGFGDPKIQSQPDSQKEITALNGIIHAVAFVSHSINTLEIAKEISTNPIFPDKSTVNVDFIKLVKEQDPYTLEIVKSWIKDVGEDILSGSSACASVIAATKINPSYYQKNDESVKQFTVLYNKEKVLIEPIMKEAFITDIIIRGQVSEVPNKLEDYL